MGSGQTRPRPLGGGGSGAGKTSVAGLLVERFGLRLQSSDAAIRVHSAQMDASVAPLLDRFRRMSMDERWLQHDPVTMHRSFPWFHGEGLDLVLEDLRRLPEDRLVLAEGLRLLPGLVLPHLVDARHAVWLLPTPAFRRAAFAGREAKDAFWRRTSLPGRAMGNLLERDHIFTEELAGDCARTGARVVRIDGKQTVEDLAETLAKRFGLPH